MTYKPALLAGIKLLVDAGKDVVDVLQPGQNMWQRVQHFENLLPDVMGEMAVIEDLPGELSGLGVVDIAQIAGALVGDLAFNDAHAQNIANASLKLLGDLASGVVPDSLALFSAIKDVPAPVAPAPAPKPAA